MTVRTWLHGYSGKMGQELRLLLLDQKDRWSLQGGTSQSRLFDARQDHLHEDWSLLESLLADTDLLIDFSAAAGNQQLFHSLGKLNFQNKALLIGTTGLNAEAKSSWISLARERNLRLLLAPNTSLGVLLTLKVSELIARVVEPLGFDVEILESHHRAKLDAPSGTAVFLAEGIAGSLGKQVVYGRTGQRQKNEIGVASLRGGSVYGEHDIRFLGDHEEICVTHRALNRSLFAQGALILSRWLVAQKPGAYKLEDISIEAMLKLLKE